MKLARSLISVSLLSFFGCAEAGPLRKRAVAYYNPSAGGGKMLDDSGYGLGEPLNETVLTNDGFLNYARSLGFSTECLGFHLGDPQSANLGDGNGPVNQTVELRADYGNADVGTCFESLVGGNHLRVFRQNGPNANSGALFLAQVLQLLAIVRCAHNPRISVSTEENVSEHHTISSDGYDVGRDSLVATATNGQTEFKGVKYSTTSEDVSSLLAAGSDGVNHGIAQDGVVKLLTVTIV